jgi:hypothetical protein
MKRNTCYRFPPKTLHLSVILLVFLAAACPPFLCTPSYGATEADIRDAILGRTPVDMSVMDLNKDGKVDVADIVKSYHDQIAASFALARSTTDESAGSHNVQVLFSAPMSATLYYTVGGTATAGTDYQTLSGLVAVNGNNVTIPVYLISDTVYEGNETVKLTLLPRAEYQLGAQTTHTITLKDNPHESSADYIFNLSSETMGVSGSTTDQKGFPSTLFSRIASVNITFSENNILNARLNTARSIGLTDNLSGATTISAKSVSYGANTIEMVFEYGSHSDSFVSDPSITTGFDPENPSLGQQNKKTLTNTLTLRINEVDISANKFTSKVLQGTFSFQIAGVLREATTQFFQGKLAGIMQR